MWTINETPEMSEALRLELYNRWSFDRARLYDLHAVCRQPQTDLFTLDQLVEHWLTKPKLCGLRKGIQQAFDNGHVDAAMRALELYVEHVAKQIDNKEFNKIVHVDKLEKVISIPCDSFKAKPYRFLNALLIAFPNVVLKTPGIMEGDWMANAFKDENAAATSIALMAGYESLVVSSSLYVQDMSRQEYFVAGFREAFGSSQTAIAHRIGSFDKEQSKTLLSFFKKYLTKNEARDGGIISGLKYSMSGRYWAFDLFAKAGLTRLRPVHEKLCSQYASDNRSNMMLIYLTRNGCPPEKMGNFFDVKDITGPVMDYVMREDRRDTCLTAFLSGYTAEDQAMLCKKYGFSRKYLPTTESHRVLMLDDFNI